MPGAVHRRDFIKADGRALYLYGTRSHDGDPLPESLATGGERPHLRWHPLRMEWVVHAPHRHRREAALPPGLCALCPATDAGVGEVPFLDFEVAVFENRFASFHRDASVPPEISVPVAPARGTCEVVVYSPAHGGSLGDLDQTQLEVLTAAWSDRFTDLYRDEHIALVYPFENRGKGIGGSLIHPHGQIYALPYLPLIVEREVEAFREGPVLLRLLDDLEPGYVVVEDEHHVVFVPPFARYAYEVWIVPRRRVAGPWEYRDDEAASFAWMMGEMYRRFDALVDGDALPFMMILHAAPRGEEDRFHFHVEFYPPHRPGQKARPHVAVEFGLWVHLLEAPLDEAVARLRVGSPASRHRPR